MRHDRQSVRTARRLAVRSLHDAEMAVLVAGQRAARRDAVRAIDAGLSARHGAAVALVVARFADRRASVAGMDQSARAALMRQIASEEAHELARLALEHAAEKRAMRSSALLSMVTAQRAERRIMRRRNRRQQIVMAVPLHLPRRGPARQNRRVSRARLQLPLSGRMS